MEYIDNWSLSLDMKILAKTLPAVISGQGAH
jgi:lipopolysaccharide/colanic/teichoic acid biosynthesis glycosyltransferase